MPIVCCTRIAIYNICIVVVTDGVTDGITPDAILQFLNVVTPTLEMVLVTSVFVMDDKSTPVTVNIGGLPDDVTVNKESGMDEPEARIDAPVVPTISHLQLGLKLSPVEPNFIWQFRKRTPVLVEPSVVCPDMAKRLLFVPSFARVQVS